MVSGSDRPVPRAQGLDPAEGTAILREILEIERARLVEAVRMEKERRIVFPETTVIIKDIERLVLVLRQKESGGTEGPDPDDLLDGLLAEVEKG